MAWPSDLNTVVCSGFKPALLPDIIAAVEKKEVRWHPNPLLWQQQCGAKFDWNGSTYKLVEEWELVQSVARLGKARP